jgi:hypothetical protein
MRDLKIIQDFAELATRSENDSQLHLCCITHKTLSLYNKSTQETTASSFKTVEGRFKEIKFNRSLEQNYQIISFALNKKPEFSTYFEQFKKRNTLFYDNIKELNLFDDDKTEDYLFKGCFPLNPLTVYSIIQLSELIAQNERTLFTFISDNDENSLNSFISNNGEGLFDVSKVYDYFYSLFKKEDANHIKNLWYRCESSLTRVSNQIDKKILKALAIIYMINDFDKFSPTPKHLALALGEDESLIVEELQKLYSEKIIKKNYLTNFVGFASSNSKEIDNELNKIMLAQSKNFNISDVIDDINENKFVLPRRYNENHKMTRFYRVLFIEDEQLMNYTSFSQLFEENYCDGIIINLLRRKTDINPLLAHFQKINDYRVILKYPNEPLENSFFDEIKKYAAYISLLKYNQFDEVTLSELDIIVSECRQDLKKAISIIFDGDNVNFINSFFENEESFNNLLSNVFEMVFAQTPVINNELLNKKNVSKQYEKSRNIVVDMVLEHNRQFDELSPTSAETTIVNSIIKKRENQDIALIVDIIKDFISESENSKKSFEDLVKRLLQPPYGIRAGVIPVLLAMGVNEFSDNIILYYQTKEIDLNANSLTKVIDAPDKYFISLEQGSSEQEDYLNRVIKLFEGQAVHSFRDNVRIACELMRKWFVGLPKILRELTVNNSFGINDRYILIKSEFMKFNINNYSVLFNRIPSIFQCEKTNYGLLYRNLNILKKTYTDQLNIYLNGIVKNTIKVFSEDYKGSLIMCIREWESSLQTPISQMILEYDDKKVYETIEKFNFDDKDCVNQLARVTTGVFIEDWDKNKETTYYEKLKKFKQDIEEQTVNVDMNDNIYQLLTSFDSLANEENSILGKMLKSNIENNLEEYGDSVSSNEKIKILIGVLKKLV